MNLMYDKAVLKALENLNLERIYLTESSAYRNGQRLERFKKAFPKHIFSFVLKYLRNKEIKKKVDSISNYIPPENVKYADPAPEGLTGVAYTCITDGYDVPKNPLYIDPCLDYILFTNSSTDDLEKTNIWKSRMIDKVAVSPQNNSANRFYKFHPFELFHEYNFSIYIDGNVQLISDTSSLFAVARNSKSGIAMHRHATMNCAYKNAVWCEYNHRGNISAIRKQTEKYHKEGFPEDFGLLEATIIVVDLHNENARKIMDEWWKEFCITGGGRDQISLPYVLWKNGYSIDDIGNLGNDEYHNPKFRIVAHKGDLF